MKITKRILSAITTTAKTMEKRFWVLSVAAAMLCTISAFSMSATADSLPSGEADFIVSHGYELKYVVQQDGTARIDQCVSWETMDREGWTGAGYRAIVPEQLDGYTVTAIGNDQNDSITKQQDMIGVGYMEDCFLPETLITIGEKAFTKACLKEVYIPRSVQTIGDYALGYNYSILDIIPGGNLYGPLVKTEGFTVFGYAGTAAEQYAQENNFRFVDMGENACGDIDADGECLMKDALLLYRFASGKADLLTAHQLRGDMNGDGVTNTRDAAQLYADLGGRV